MATTELFLDLADPLRLAIECPTAECQARLTIDLTSPEVSRRATGWPGPCPVCGQPLHDNLREALVGFRDSYAGLRTAAKGERNKHPPVRIWTVIPLESPLGRISG